MQRLSGLDAIFLYLETPTNHMHVGSTVILDPSTMPGGYSFEAVRSLVARRLPLLPPFRRRLVEVPFGFHHPVWVEDPDFDLDYHLRRAALPSPGGKQELEDFAGAVFGRSLDRSRPLWEMYAVEGLEHGYVAIVTKTHHAAIDGVSGAELTVNLLDTTPEPDDEPAVDEWMTERIPTDIEMALYALRSLARQPQAAVKAAQRTATMAVTLRRRNRQPDVQPPPALFSAPKTSLNTRITPHRRYAMTEVSLADIKRIKNAVGATVNDVVANDTERTVSPHSGHGSPARPCTRMPDFFSALRPAAGRPADRATAPLSTSMIAAWSRATSSGLRVSAIRNGLSLAMWRASSE